AAGAAGAAGGPSASGASARPGAATMAPAGPGTATGLAVRDIDRRLWSVALLAGVVGALLTSGAGVVAGQYHHSTTVVRPIEQVVDPAAPYVTIAANPRAEDIVDVAARLRPMIVQLLVNTNGANVTGSGVIFRSDGYILTNDHVVEGAQSVIAVMSDGHRIRCHLVGTDRATDLAVVKLPDGRTTQANVATLGTSTQLKVGQPTMAIGSPVGLAGGTSVTSGIISAVDRQVSSGNGPPLLDMIQTDASIEPGSSGGALVDSAGMVIGITTALALGDQSVQSLGFATPIEVAKDVANQILSTGKVTHAWIGVQGADVDLATAKLLGIRGGAVIESIEQRSPAAWSGLTATDVIVAFAGQSVDSMSGLEMSIREHRPGDHVAITFIRDGQTRASEVVLLERPIVDWP
ncbi:MAG: S1C family serine protease, partial [Actinomycetota bacterium]|nr:S1C family serine protease [Actinomycetota bacterium]